MGRECDEVGQDGRVILPARCVSAKAEGGDRGQCARSGVSGWFGAGRTGLWCRGVNFG